MNRQTRNTILWTIFTIVCISIAIVLALFAKHRENILDLIQIRDPVISDYVSISENLGQSRILFFCVDSGGNSPECSDWLENELERTAGLEPLIPKQYDIGKTYSTALSLIPSLFTHDNAAKIDNICSENNLSCRMKFFAGKLSSMESPAYKTILLSDPAGLSSLFFDRLYSGISKNLPSISTPRKKLFAMEGDFPSIDSKRSRSLVSKIQTACQNTIEKFPGISIAYSGAYRISSDNAKIAESDASLCLKLGVSLILILCFLGFNNKICAFAVILPSLAGTAIALSVSSLALDELSTISIAFASIAIGVGIDYAVHLIYALKSNPDPHPYGMIRPVSAAAGTTLTAFLTMCALGSKGLFQIGFFGSISVATSAVLSFFMIPGMIPENETNRVTFFERLARFAIFLLNKAKNIIVPTIITFTIVSICFVPFLKFDGKISNLSARSAESQGDYETIGKTLGEKSNTKKIIVKCDSDDETLSEAWKISNFLRMSGITDGSISNILPPRDISKDNIRRWKKYWTPGQINLLKRNLNSAALSAGIKSHPLLKRIDEYFSGKIDYDPKRIIDSGLLKAWATNTSNGIDLVIDVPNLKTVESAKFYDYIRKNFNGAIYIDMEYFGEHISMKVREWLFTFTCAALILVAAYLLIAMGGPIKAVKVILPLLFGLLWALGMLAAIGIEINIVNVIFTLFAICMAQDYAMFLSTTNKPTSSLAAVLLSSSTTLCAFGMFVLSEHPVLHGLGLTASISIASILVASILFFGLFLPKRK